MFKGFFSRLKPAFNLLFDRRTHPEDLVVEITARIKDTYKGSAFVLHPEDCGEDLEMIFKEYSNLEIARLAEVIFNQENNQDD